MRWKIIGCPCTQKYFMQHKEAILFRKKELRNKQSAKVICRFDRLRAHSKKQKRLSSTYTINYIVLRVTLAWLIVKTLLWPCQWSSYKTGHRNFIPGSYMCVRIPFSMYPCVSIWQHTFEQPQGYDIFIKVHFVLCGRTSVCVSALKAINN